MPSAGQSTRFGLDTRICRAPCGPGTSIVVASDAMPPRYRRPTTKCERFCDAHAGCPVAARSPVPDPAFLLHLVGGPTQKGPRTREGPSETVRYLDASVSVASASSAGA